jgi:hypothetical protein
MTSYLAPTYFPPSYFATGGGSPPVAGIRDRDVFQKMVEAVGATGEFSEVVYMLPGTMPEAADSNPVLGVMPRGWKEVESGDGSGLMRSVRYQIWIIVREQLPQSRYDWGDRLACLVQNRIDGSSLGGTCVPELSVLRSGTIPETKDPNALTVILEGEFVYGVDPSVGRATEA